MILYEGSGIIQFNVWELHWFTNDLSPKALFPQYFKHVGEERVAVAAAEVPAETSLLSSCQKQEPFLGRD